MAKKTWNMDDFKKDLYFQILFESAELSRKMIALQKLRESDDFTQLSPWHQEKTKSQVVAMRHYLDILDDRLKELGKDISVF